MKMINNLFLFSLLFSLFSTTAALAGESMKYQRLADVPAAKWQELAKKKIYFGHQSVGFNIIDGLSEVMKEHPDIKLNIVETRKAKGNGGALMHSRVGKNRSPDTKIKDFVNVIDQELGVVPDAAALKFCYVDAYDKIDVREIFQEYREAMEKLEKEHPGLTVIHFTMPLRTQKISWKTRLKTMLGKDAWELEDNARRNEYNRLLLETYQGREPVFDIAAIEAGEPGGKKVTFKYKGQEYLAMNPAYSSDGGHLNHLGQKVVAEQFLLFLANTL